MLTDFMEVVVAAEKVPLALEKPEKSEKPDKRERNQQVSPIKVKNFVEPSTMQDFKKLLEASATPEA